jgi:hypothetical protein
VSWVRETKRHARNNSPRWEPLWDAQTRSIGIRAKIAKEKIRLDSERRRKEH